jgi:hypothetical protein
VEDVNTPAGGAGAVEPAGQALADQRSVRPHAEEHRYGFIDRQRLQPAIVAAPRREGGDGDLRPRIEPRPQLAQEQRVVRALRLRGVEVDLDVPRFHPCRNVRDGIRHARDGAHVRRMSRLDPDDREDLRALRHPQRLHARFPDDALAVDADRRCEIRDLTRTEEPQILATLPRPRDFGGWDCGLRRSAGAGGEEEGWQQCATHSLQ